MPVRYSTRLANAIHIMVYISIFPDQPMTSTDIAQSVKTNPSYIRTIMAHLKAGGLIESTKGKACPVLARDPEEISLLDIYKAIEGDKPLLHLDTHVNPECNVGVYVQQAISDCYRQVQEAAESEMRQISLQGIIDLFEKKRPLD